MNELHRAGDFVVQFRASTDFDLGHVAGRVEHVASSQVANFESVSELIEIMTKVLKTGAQSTELIGGHRWQTK